MQLMNINGFHFLTIAETNFISPKSEKNINCGVKNKNKKPPSKLRPLAVLQALSRSTISITKNATQVKNFNY